MFNIETYILSMLFGIIDSIQNGIEHTNFVDLFNTDRKYDSRTQYLDYIINYQDDFWKKFSESLLEVQKVFFINIMQLTVHQNIIKANLLNSKLFLNTSEYNIQNWSINLIEPQFSFKDLYSFACKG